MQDDADLREEASVGEGMLQIWPCPPVPVPQDPAALGSARYPRPGTRPGSR